MKDIYGTEIKVGDWIQGYNNIKYASHKDRLFPTNPIRLSKEFEFKDIFQIYPETGLPWIWKLNIKTKSIEIPENKFTMWVEE